MRRWSELAERLAATTRTSEKTAILADYFRTLTPDELPIAAVFLTGRPFAEADQRAAGLGWSAIATTVTDLGGVPRSALGEAYDRSSDLGIAVADVLTAAGHAAAARGEPDAPRGGRRLRRDRAGIRARPASRRSCATLLERADPLTAKYIVKVLGGDLRIGLREGLRGGGHRARRSTGRSTTSNGPGCSSATSAGWPASRATTQLGNAALALFHPLKFMLASPAEDAAEIVTRLGPEVWVEDKYDGIRAQLHKRGREVRLYSRDLHDVSSRLPRDRRGGGRLAWDGILDGEILGWRDGTVLPFIALQARLGRKSPSAAIQAEVPVIFVAFDALALGPGGDDAGRAAAARAADRAAAPLDALDLPLGERRRPVRPLAPDVAADADALEAAFVDARGAAQRGADGQGPRERLLARAGAAWAG